MLGAIARKLFGTTNDRIVKALGKTVTRINALEPEAEALSDEALRARTDEFRRRLADGESIDDILTVANASGSMSAKA